MAKLFGFILDVVAALVLLGACCFMVWFATDGTQFALPGGTVRGLCGAALAILFVISFGIQLALAWGAWDIDPSSTRLGRIYRIPFLNAVVAYYRLRTGKGFLHRRRPQRFPWSKPEAQERDERPLDR